MGQKRYRFAVILIICLSILVNTIDGGSDEDRDGDRSNDSEGSTPTSGRSSGNSSGSNHASNSGTNHDSRSDSSRGSNSGSTDPDSNNGSNPDSNTGGSSRGSNSGSSRDSNSGTVSHDSESSTVSSDSSSSLDSDSGNFIPCPAEDGTVTGIQLTFEMAEPGTIANSTQFCPNGTTNTQLPLATRICASPWLDPELTNCFNSSSLVSELTRITQENITKSNVANIAVRLVLLSNEPDALNPLGLELILDSLTRIVEVDSESPRLTDSVIGVIDKILDIDSETLEEVPDVDKVIDLLEDQLFNVQKYPENYNVKGDNVAASAVKVNRSALGESFIFKDPIEDTNDKEDDKRFSRPTVTLPSSVADQIPDKPNVTEIPLTFFVFRETDIFRTSEEDDVISPVISAKVDIENVTISNLPKSSPVVIEFMRRNGKANKDSNEGAVCVFWNNMNTTTGGQWSTEGCETRPHDNGIVCLCNHLTSFALLVRGDSESDRYIEAYHQTLTIITTVGCYLSVIGLMICLIMMIALKTLRVKQETQVHINLCLALIGFYLTFVIGIDRTGNPTTCRFISALVHWLCLSSLAWMSVEAFIIYKLIYRFERSNNEYLILRGAIFAWGMPALVAILVAFLDKSHDYALEPDFCFLHRGVGFYFGFLGIVCLLTAFNAFVFVLACYRIIFRQINAVDKKEQRRETAKRVYSAFLFWVLLGLSWIFGIFSTFESNFTVVFQIIFCVFLSLQGVFLFYFLCAQNPKVQERARSIFVDVTTGNYRISFSKQETSTSVPMKK